MAWHGAASLSPAAATSVSAACIPGALPVCPAPSAGLNVWLLCPAHLILSTLLPTLQHHSQAALWSSPGPSLRLRARLLNARQVQPPPHAAPAWARLCHQPCDGKIRRAGEGGSCKAGVRGSREARAEGAPGRACGHTQQDSTAGRYQLVHVMHILTLPTYPLPTLLLLLPSCRRWWQPAGGSCLWCVASMRARRSWGRWSTWLSTQSEGGRG